MKYLFSFFIMLVTFQAHADDLYTVKGVQVDVKAESAAAAEHKAMQEGRAKAFKMLVERLVPESDRGGLDNVSQEQLEDMVESFEVNSQKNSKVRYVADMTFFFDGTAVQRFLGNRTIAAVDEAKQPLVVVPVFLDQGGIYLWGEQNLWLQAWAKREKLSTVTPLVVPLGDLKDMATVDGQQIISGEVSGLKELARRYGGAGVVVVTMRRDSANSMAPMNYDANLVNLDGQAHPLSQTRMNTNQGAQSLQFDQAINQVIKELESQAREQSRFASSSNPAMGAVSGTGEGQLLAIVPLQDQRSWQIIQASLKGSAEVKQLVVKGLTRKQATVLIAYRGTTASLESALNARGLRLEQMNGGQAWVITANASKP